MSLLTKLVVFLKRGDKSLFDIPVERQKKFMESLGYPQDDIDRSFKQYLCQNLFVSGWKKFAFNVVALIFFPIEVLFFILNGLRNDVEEPVEAVAIFKGVEEVIPDILYKQYKIKIDCEFEHLSLKRTDLFFIGRLFFRFIFHPYFVFKSTANIAKYSFLINKYKPSTVLVHAEFAFSSSLLTEYCHSQDVRHINIMHGEKLYFVRDSFFHYDECYVWDAFYKELFISLGAEKTQFKIAVPKSLVINCEQYTEEKYFADYKYYLVECSREELMSIIKSMSFVMRAGKTLKYRPHPRWTDMVLLRSLVPDSEIENPSEVNIMQSVANLKYAVGSYTTVLTQAKHSGKNIILDDVTYRSQYTKLKELQYILVNKEHGRLSLLQNEIM